jgi:hypothetical protein
MSIVKTEILGQEALTRAEKLLAGIPNGVEKATKSAMQRAISHLRTNSTKAIRERYAIAAGNIRANENITVRYSFGGVQAIVTFAGRKIPLYRYNGAGAGARPTEKVPVKIGDDWKTVLPAPTGIGHVLNMTSPYRFRNAFIAGFSSGHMGIFESTGGVTSNGYNQIKEVMGLSVPQMIGKDEVAEKLTEESMSKFEERLGHEVLRLLNGWGG